MKCVYIAREKPHVRSLRTELQRESRTETMMYRSIAPEARVCLRLMSLSTNHLCIHFIYSLALTKLPNTLKHFV